MRLSLLGVTVQNMYPADELADSLEKLAKEVREISNMEKEQPIQLTITMLTTTSIDTESNKFKRSAWTVSLHTEVAELTQPELKAYAERREQRIIIQQPKVDK